LYKHSPHALEAPGMAIDPNAIEQAVSRTLRDNLGRIQRTSEELNQAINDLVSSCASSRATNTLPPMVRAQASAAAIAAALEVLSRFVTAALQPSVQPSLQPSLQPRVDLEQLGLTPPATSEFSFVSALAPEPAVSVKLPRDVTLTPTSAAIASLEPPAPVLSHPIKEEPKTAAQEAWDSPALDITQFALDPVHEIKAPVAAAPISLEPLLEPGIEPLLEPPVEVAVSESELVFSLASLPVFEQELHRRAYRVAKVSMQDIKLLRPEDVRAGRENNDLCLRLRDDIEKAHKEYDRRFQAIQSHPVDYFYDWMVEILAGGNPQALGEYPYASTVQHR
jgi:hypothetical protein